MDGQKTSSTREETAMHVVEARRASMYHDAQPRALTHKSKAASMKNTEYTENVKSPVA